jgi:hypothetical protein
VRERQLDRPLDCQRRDSTGLSRTAGELADGNELIAG